MTEENNIIIYQTQDGKTKIDVKIDNDTVWLNQAQIAELLQTTKQNISSHIQNIFKEQELVEDSVVKDFLTTASDGKDYNVKYYNLDVLWGCAFRNRLHSQRESDSAWHGLLRNSCARKNT